MARRPSTSRSSRRFGASPSAWLDRSPSCRISPGWRFGAGGGDAGGGRRETAGRARLGPGAPFTLPTRQVLGSAQEVSVAYARLTEDLQPGDSVLLSDGDLELEVIAIAGEDVQCRVITGGPLASRKGVHLPARSVTAPAFTDKDREDLAFGLRHGVDYVALSTVRTAAEILEARGMIQDHGSSVPLIAKIETAEALTHIDEIVDGADGGTAARG